ncbi:unnamed protein product [Toxocara canis]|uniref:Secreted protein n=1 Tax=Toxocara canis TaxID=6265 RepID=A0A183UVC5_TOXCA|nr:unnamed protein product [Toxocara canis]
MGRGHGIRALNVAAAFWPRSQHPIDTIAALDSSESRTRPGRCAIPPPRAFLLVVGERFGYLLKKKTCLGQSRLHLNLKYRNVIQLHLR